MIKNAEKYGEFDRQSRAGDHLTLGMKYRILDGLYAEARRLGHFSGANPLEGIEEVIRLAAMLNVDVRTPPR
jgi:hypothetical protein